MLTDEVKEVLSPIRGGITLIITVGNTFRSDDGVGPYIARNVKIKNENTVVLNVEDQPENAIDQAVSIKPCKTVIIDAADFFGKVGEARVIPQENIPDTTLSTHTFPIKVITKILEEDTGSKISFIGIQPRSAAMGEGLCDEVKQTADEIIEFISRGIACYAQNISATDEHR